MYVETCTEYNNASAYAHRLISSTHFATEIVIRLGILFSHSKKPFQVVCSFLSSLLKLDIEYDLCFLSSEKIIFVIARHMGRRSIFF